MNISIVLIEPDIPQNTGAIMRLCACLARPLHLIEPFGFIWDVQKLKRGGLDYLEQTILHRHLDYHHFLATINPRRTILFTTHAEKTIDDMIFDRDDFFLFGNESSGAPKTIHQLAHQRIRVPLSPKTRSLNLATTIGFALGVAHQQFLSRSS
ncbi:MAG: tRNA (cytidine(34)-2'-O)-methyltransferase [Alphaproteobacteria bacterium]